jgi:uncharacterized membrane protein YraQ (UPF0718 family)
MIALIIITVVCVALSLIADPKKTLKGLSKGAEMFAKLVPVIVSVIAVVSIIISFIPQETIVNYLGESAGSGSYFIAALFGAIALIPGFIAYPLSGMLVQNGVSYQVVAVFITTLMMVGVVTLPIESRFFGYKVAIIRNVLFFLGALIIGALMGFIYSLG